MSDCLRLSTVRGIASERSVVGWLDGDALASNQAPAVAARVTEHVARARTAAIHGAAWYRRALCWIAESDNGGVGGVVGARVGAVDEIHRAESDEIVSERRVQLQPYQTGTVATVSGRINRPPQFL